MRKSLVFNLNFPKEKWFDADYEIAIGKKNEAYKS